MSSTEAALLLLAGLAAGTVNATVGSGSLITFPTLLAFGYPPLLANVTNNVGVLPGSFSAVAISRAELAGQGQRLARLSIAALLGALVGAWLLLVLPGEVFDAVVPALIALACLLVAVQPWIAGRVRRRGRPIGHGAALLWIGVLLTAVYGGYFGAAQGVILIAIIGLFVDAPLPQLNAVKNVLAGLANLAAAAVFVFATEVAWGAAAAIAVGATIGGQFGPRIGRRLPPVVYRTTVVVVGLAVALVLLLD